MKVKIGFTDWVDSEKIRMCIQLTRKEANDISKMHPLCTIYAQIPEKIDQEDSQSVRDWMYTGTKRFREISTSKKFLGSKKPQIGFTITTAPI